MVTPNKQQIYRYIHKSVKSYSKQGDHLSGKPGNVGNLKPVREMSGNLCTVREFVGNKPCHGKGTKNWLFLVAYFIRTGN